MLLFFFCEWFMLLWLHVLYLSSPGLFQYLIAASWSLTVFKSRLKTLKLVCSMTKTWSLLPPPLKLHRFICLYLCAFCVFLFYTAYALYYCECGGVDLMGLKPNFRTYLPLVLWRCWLGHLTHKNLSPIWPIISEVTALWWNRNVYIIMRLLLSTVINVANGRDFKTLMLRAEQVTSSLHRNMHAWGNVQRGEKQLK